MIVSLTASTPPTPYTTAVASEATSVRAVKKTRFVMAMRTPMSRTWPARSANSTSSVLGRPKSLTSSAPATLNRSVMRPPSSALSCIDCRVMSAMRAPIRRAGIRKRGSSSKEMTVIGQDSTSMAPATRASDTTFDTTPDRVEVNACCAPITSLLSRDTSAPVWARVKNATGWRSTCPKTWVRRS